MAKSNKGKVLRNGHYVPKRAYHMSEELRAKLEAPVEEWYSEKTGKSYSSEARMRAAEKASERMSVFWKVKKIDEKYLPMSWYDIPSDVRTNWPHGGSDGKTMLGRIFVIENGGGVWDEIGSGTFINIYKDLGLDQGNDEQDGDGYSLKDFIEAVIGISWEDIDANDLPDIEEI